MMKGETVRHPRMLCEQRALIPPCTPQLGRRLCAKERKERKDRSMERAQGLVLFRNRAPMQKAKSFHQVPWENWHLKRSTAFEFSRESNHNIVLGMPEGCRGVDVKDLLKFTFLSNVSPGERIRLEQSFLQSLTPHTKYSMHMLPRRVPTITLFTHHGQGN